MIQLVNGKRSITAEMALRLATYFGTSPGLWLNLQKKLRAPPGPTRNDAPDPKRSEATQIGLIHCFWRAVKWLGPCAQAQGGTRPDPAGQDRAMTESRKFAERNSSLHRGIGMGLITGKDINPFKPQEARGLHRLASVDQGQEQPSLVGAISLARAGVSCTLLIQSAHNALRQAKTKPVEYWVARRYELF